MSTTTKTVEIENARRLIAELNVSLAKIGDMGVDVEIRPFLHQMVSRRNPTAILNADFTETTHL